MDEDIVRRGPSAINGDGVFSQRAFQAGAEIAPLALGPACEQDKHSLLVGAQHRVVEPPWRYLNHACTPTTRLRFEHDAVYLIAARALEPGTELTIDYTALPERVSIAFECRCPRCLGSATPASLGLG